MTANVDSGQRIRAARRAAHPGAVVFVTGAGRGIGRTIAGRLSAEGASIAMLARSRMELDAAAASIRASGGNVIAIPTDIADPSQVIAAIDEAEAVLGPISILVNNATISPATDLVRGSFEAWEAVI